MHKNINVEANSYDLVNFINFSISFMPFLYILGAPWMEIPVAMATIYLIFFLIKNFNKKNHIIITDKLNLIFILLFLTIIFLSSVLSKENLSIIKSLAYVRFIFFYLYIINFYNVKNFKKLIDLSFIGILFVIFDIYIQFIFGRDIFGYLPGLEGTRYQGPFGNELISGSFFKYFFFISFSCYFLTHQKLKYSFLFLSILSVILSGEKSNVVMFFFGIILILIFDIKKNYKFFIIFISSLLIFITLIYNYSFFNFNENFTNKIKKINNRYTIHLKQSIGYELKDIKGTKINNSIKNSPHVLHFISAYEIFRDNKFLGVGIKNFRKVCKNLDDKKYSKLYNLNIIQFNKYKCATHPHNVHLEILSEVGLLGYIMFILIVLRILYRFILFQPKNDSLNHINITLILLIFPLATTGSFFTNKNSIIFWMVLSIITTLMTKTKREI
jgi:O-antigen ligase